MNCFFYICTNNFKVIVYKKLSLNQLNRVDIEEFKLIPKNPIIVILDNVRSQHNIGSVFRSCDAFAIEKLYLCGICATPPSPEIRKSAIGAEESVDWSYSNNTLDCVLELKREGYTILAVEQTQNSTMLDSLIYNQNKKYALIFGNEVKGVSQEVINICDGTIEIPQFGTKHSLNISVSVGIVLWEFVSIQNKNKNDR